MHKRPEVVLDVPALSVGLLDHTLVVRASQPASKAALLAARRAIQAACQGPGWAALVMVADPGMIEEAPRIAADLSAWLLDDNVACRACATIVPPQRPGPTRALSTARQAGGLPAIPTRTFSSVTEALFGLDAAAPGADTNHAWRQRHAHVAYTAPLSARPLPRLVDAVA